MRRNDVKSLLLCFLLGFPFSLHADGDAESEKGKEEKPQNDC